MAGKIDAGGAEQAQVLFPTMRPAATDESAEDEGDEGTPSVSVDSNVDSGGAPLEVHFTSQVDGAPPGAVLVWDFGDGSTARNQFNPVHTYKTPGQYDVELTLSWGVGKDADSTSDSTSIEVDEQAFDVSIDADPSSGVAPLQVQLEASVGDDAQSGLRYDWDLDNGQHVIGRKPEPVFSDPGTYDVTVVVTNSAGQHGSGEVEIDVEAP